MTMILPIHQRMVEITRRLKWDHNLTPATKSKLEYDLDHCLQANELHCTKLARLENLSLLASETGDVPWQHELCLEIEQLQS